MCCGKGRAQLNTRRNQPGSIPPYVAAPDPQQPRVSFVYLGNTAMTVTGPVSGLEYRFSQPGSRLEVDARDRILLASIRQLRQVN
jgi:hypothetical protein